MNWRKPVYLTYASLRGYRFPSLLAAYLREYERGVIFRLGRLLPEAKGPGLIFVGWPIDKIVKVPLRTVTLGSMAAARRAGT